MDLVRRHRRSRLVLYPVVSFLSHLRQYRQPDSLKSSMEHPSVRHASHAGSWYTDHGPTLASQLQGWLDDAEREMVNSAKLPPPGARVIIAP